MPERGADRAVLTFSFFLVKQKEQKENPDHLVKSKQPVWLQLLLFIEFFTEG
jgi:hypothetical protein